MTHKEIYGIAQVHAMAGSLESLQKVAAKLDVMKNDPIKRKMLNERARNRHEEVLDAVEYNQAAPKDDPELSIINAIFKAWQDGGEIYCILFLFHQTSLMKYT